MSKFTTKKSSLGSYLKSKTPTKVSTWDKVVHGNAHFVKMEQVIQGEKVNLYVMTVPKDFSPLSKEEESTY